MDDLERLALIREVYLKCYDETETFESVGETLAYLLGAIATKEQVSLCVDDPGELEFQDLLFRCFDKDHVVWGFIIGGSNGYGI